MAHKHSIYIKKTGFLKGKNIHELYGMSQKEYEFIDAKGFWFEALSKGKLTPETKAQEHFILVCKDMSEAKTVYEELWLRVKVILKTHRARTFIEEGILTGDNAVLQMDILSSRLFGLPECAFDQLVKFIRCFEKTSAGNDFRVRCQTAVSRILDIKNKDKHRQWNNASVSRWTLIK